MGFWVNVHHPYEHWLKVPVELQPVTWGARWFRVGDSGLWVGVCVSGLIFIMFMMNMMNMVIWWGWIGGEGRLGEREIRGS